MKSYTDLEQSKRLAKILPLESADMMHDRLIVIPFNDGSLTPCWSLAALMKLLPSEFTTENKFGKYKYEIDIRKYKLTDDVDIYQIAYGNYKWYEDGSHSWKDMINTGQKEELLDVAFDMVCWLKENNKI
jgi:hypothetical protein